MSTEPATGAATGGAYAVGWPLIDELHAECDVLLQRLAGAADSAHVAAIDLLVQHLHEHFGAEEALMQASRYGRYDCHKREHEAVLRVVERVRPMVEAGDHAVARRLSVEFPHWLDLHARSMDTQLAEWLVAESAPAPGSGSDSLRVADSGGRPAA